MVQGYGLKAFRALRAYGFAAEFLCTAEILQRVEVEGDFDSGLCCFRPGRVNIVPLKQKEYGFGYLFVRSPSTPYSIDLRGTIGCF